MYGDPHVYFDLINGTHSASVTNRWNNKLGTIGDVYGGGNAAKVVGDTYVNIGTKTTVLRADETTNAPVLGVNISGNIYGGGNAADVTGKTNVTVGK
ncbi:MAG: hypothetical protein KBS99_06840 [Prevotellaceae bacterium]|nr:hypothetical protein [Candidatus Colivivens caballi]